MISGKCVTFFFWGGGGGVNRDCVPEPVFFSPSPKSDYTVSAIKIV